ncbi:MAG TPA: PIN domain-containing protein [Streptosporangiaceae bacterium]
MIIADTSGLLAAFGHDTRPHQEARTVYESDPGPVIISPFVLAELDYLILRNAGIKAELDLLRDVADGVFALVEFSPRDVAQAAAVAGQYSDQRIGLADASIVVLAARYRTTRVLTLDERHFRVMRPLHAEAFTILPADHDER